MKLKFLYALLLSPALVSCVEEKPVNADDAIKLELDTGDGIIKSIDMITSGKNWTQARFDSINTAINQLAANGLLDRTIDEDKSHLKNLFTASASYLQHRVDSVFSTSRYNGYSRMKSDLAFLKKYHKIYLQAEVRLDNPNKALQTVGDIFINYDKVLNLSHSNFGQTPVFFKGYNRSFAYTKKSIESNKYYAKYFSHNSEITAAVRDFPNRVNKSKYRYMDGLEKVIEQQVLKDSMSLERVLDIQTDFYQMADGVNKQAVNNLNKFVETYAENINKTNSVQE